MRFCCFPPSYKAGSGMPDVNVELTPFLTRGLDNVSRSVFIGAICEEYERRPMILMEDITPAVEAIY